MDWNSPATLLMANVFISGVVAFVVSFFKIGEYRNKVDSLERTIGSDEHSGLRKTVGDIRDKVIVCETTLKEREPLTKKKSPVALTERGNRFLKDSGGEKFVDDHFLELRAAVESKSPATAYDVQECSKAIVQSLHDDKRLTPIKEFLFKDGSSLDDWFEVIAIYLRDKVLEAKKWNVDDIDKR